MIRVEQAETAKSRETLPASPPSLPSVSPPAKRRPWIGLILLCALGLAGYGAHRRYPQLISSLSGKTAPQIARQGPRSVPVVIAEARRGDLPVYLEGLGTVTALNTVTIRSRVDGELIKVTFVEGQSVQQGDLLVEIDPRPYQVQLAQAEGQLAKDEAALTFSKLDLTRYQSAPSTIVTQQQRDTAVAQVGQNEGLVKSDRAQIDAIKLQLTYCRITAPISGRVGLRLVDQGNMVHANDPTGLAVITQVEPISVVFSLSEDVLPQVLQARASGRSLAVEAQNRDKTARLALGSLLAIDNQVDPATLMVKFKAAFENKEHTLYPNQAVNIRLLIDTKKDAVLIPVAAVQRNPEGNNYVYVANLRVHSESKGQQVTDVDPPQEASGQARSRPAEQAHADKPRHANPGLEGTVELRNITVGPGEAEVVVVENGLQPGEMVVTDGVDKLQPGAGIIGQWAHASATQPAAPATRPAAGARRRGR